MFGITSQPQRNAQGRITSNPHEEIRRGAGSSTYDGAAAERMKMEYLRKERERREKERNKLMYDGKNRDYIRATQESERMKTETKRLESELAKHTHDSEGVKLLEARTVAELPAFKKEELELVQKIQKVEAELLMYKNRHQQVLQKISHVEQTDKNLVVDKHKREAYVSELQARYDASKRRFEDMSKQAEKLKVEVDQLKRLI